MWEPLGNTGDRLREITVGRNHDGRLAVIGTAGDGSIWQNWQTSPGGAWTGWQRFGALSDRLHSVALGRNHDGRLELFGVGPDDTIWHRWQTVPNGWSEWQRLGSDGDRLRRIAVGHNRDGRLEVVGTAGDETIWHAWQTSPGGSWSGMSRLGGERDRVREVSVALHHDGRLAVIATAGDATIWQNWQTSPGGAWSGWQRFGEVSDRFRSVALGRNLDGRLELIAIAPDDSIRHKWQTAPGGGWSGWQLLGSPSDRLRRIAVGHNHDGRIEAVGTAGNDSIWHAWQTSPGRWLPFVREGAVVREVSDGRVFLIVDGNKFHIPTPDALSAMGYGWGDVEIAPDGTLANVRQVGFESLSPTPGSLVFPPDNRAKWHARGEIASTLRLTSRGKEVRIVELRGWLRRVEGECHTPESDWNDWHYDLEVDPAWTDERGIDLARLITVGDVLNHHLTPEVRSSFYAAHSGPQVHVELNPWVPGKAKVSLPSDWKTTGVRTCPESIWPFHPLLPLGQPVESDPPVDWVYGEDASEPYVRVIGSLVTDAPHSTEGMFATWFSRQLNVEHATPDPTIRALRQVWGAGLTEEDPTHPGRYTEIHPPDAIVRMEPRARVETVRVVAVAARNGFFWGDAQSLDLDIFPPGAAPSPTARVRCVETVGDETNFGTIVEGNATKTGAEIQFFSDHVHIHVKVWAGALYGAPGKFKAVYRVSWEAGAPVAAGDLRVTCYSRSHGRLGGTDSAGAPWTLSRSEVIAAIERGQKFYVELSTGQRVDVVVGRILTVKYLKTRADRFLGNNLSSLPSCP